LRENNSTGFLVSINVFAEIPHKENLQTLAKLSCLKTSFVTQKYDIVF
jgi:hypothetical protein